MPTPGWLRRPDLPLDAKGRSYIDAPSLDQILDQFINWRGDQNASGYKLVGLSASYPGNIEVGFGVPGNRAAWIDLIGDDTYTDYGLRIIRNAEGPNASSDLIHRGTGALQLKTTESGPISFYIGANRILSLSNLGLTFFDGSVQASAGVPQDRQIIAGTGLTGGGNLTADRTLSVVAGTTVQQIYAGVNGTSYGPRPWLNLIAGSNVVLSGADDVPNNRINITINSTGGGTGGSQTPWLSDIDAAGFKLKNTGNVGMGNDASVLPVAGHSGVNLLVGRTASAPSAGLAAVCGNVTTVPAEIGELAFANYALGGSDKRSAIILAGTDSVGAYDNAYLAFYTMYAGGIGERVRITATGRVGIRTPTPSNILTVNETVGDIVGVGATPVAASWRSGLMVQNALNQGYDGACIQMGTGGGLGWSIKQRCLNVNEGWLSFYGYSNSTGNMHEIMRLSGGNGGGSLSVTSSDASGFPFRVIGLTGQLWFGGDSQFSGPAIFVENIAGNGFVPLGIVCEGMYLQGGPFIEFYSTTTRFMALRGTAPPAGSKELWYDPADGNRVKFAA